jgi:hypothetical protein
MTQRLRHGMATPPLKSWRTRVKIEHFGPPLIISIPYTMCFMGFVFENNFLDELYYNAQRPFDAWKTHTNRFRTINWNLSWVFRFSTKVVFISPCVLSQSNTKHNTILRDPSVMSKTQTFSFRSGLAIARRHHPLVPGGVLFDITLWIAHNRIGKNFFQQRFIYIYTHFKKIYIIV